MAGDFTTSVQELISLLKGIDIVISVIFPINARDQVPLIDAAFEAGVKRFLPCNWGTSVARGGIMDLHDLKEEVHDHMFRKRLGFTIIDIGYWYQSSFPLVPSGRFDYAAFKPLNEVYAGGTARNMLIDKRDVGTITVRVIKDARTLNKRVYAYGEVLTQNEIHALIEKKTGEKLNLPAVSANLSLCLLSQAAKYHWHRNRPRNSTPLLKRQERNWTPTQPTSPKHTCKLELSTT